MEFSISVVWPSVLSFNYLKVLIIHKKQRKTFVYKKIYTLVNFYNPELALTDFRTTRPAS